jgi:hypothetical protein
MRREVVQNRPRTIRHPSPSKVRDKGREQIRTFVNVIDGELDHIVGLITGNDVHSKVKKLLLQFLPKVRVP